MLRQILAGNNILKVRAKKYILKVPGNIFTVKKKNTSKVSVPVCVNQTLQTTTCE